MHMQGEPLTMQQAPAIPDVVAEVGAFLAARVAAVRAAGIARDQHRAWTRGSASARTWRTISPCCATCARSPRWRCRCWSGCRASRLIGTLTGRAGGERVRGSLALAVLAVLPVRASCAPTTWRRPWTRLKCRARGAARSVDLGRQILRNRWRAWARGQHPMTVDFALQLASAAARVLAPQGGTVLIGKDTRLSGTCSSRRWRPASWPPAST